MGAAVDPYASYFLRGSLGFTESIAAHVLELFPSLGDVRILRQWAGLCDMTPIVPLWDVHQSKDLPLMSDEGRMDLRPSLSRESVWLS